MIPFVTPNINQKVSSAPVIGSSDLVWTDSSPLAGHRYWRILINGVNSGTLCTISEIGFVDSGGTDLGGTWSAWNSANGAISSARDGNIGTFWGDGGGGTAGSLGHWVAVDFGVSASVLPYAVMIRARNDGFWTQCVTQFYIQYSDDNSTWFNATRVLDCSNWGVGIQKAFMLRPYIVNFKWDDPANGSFTTVSELEICNASNVDLTTASPSDSYQRAAPIGQSDGNVATFAFNNTLGSDYTGNAGNPSNTQWWFTSQPDAWNVTVTARSGFSSQCAHSFKVQTSRDGITYTLAYQSPAQAAWGSAETRRFTL